MSPVTTTSNFPSAWKMPRCGQLGHSTGGRAGRLAASGCAGGWATSAAGCSLGGTMDAGAMPGRPRSTAARRDDDSSPMPGTRLLPSQAMPSDRTCSSRMSSSSSTTSTFVTPAAKVWMSASGNGMAQPSFSTEAPGSTSFTYW